MGKPPWSSRERVLKRQFLKTFKIDKLCIHMQTFIKKILHEIIQIATKKYFPLNFGRERTDQTFGFKNGLATKKLIHTNLFKKDYFNNLGKR